MEAAQEMKVAEAVVLLLEVAAAEPEAPMLI